MYIRTKDERIAKVKENMIIKKCSENVLRLVYKDNQSICVLNGNDDIINQSENLEELCDAFVEEFPICKGNELVGKGHHYWKYDEETRTFYDDFDDNVPHKSFINKEFNFYGAIWTEWGLKYVAKMNSKGDLELI